jgi:hypothetical protein
MFGSKASIFDITKIAEEPIFDVIYKIAEEPIFDVIYKIAYFQ